MKQKITKIIFMFLFTIILLNVEAQCTFSQLGIVIDGEADGDRLGVSVSLSSDGLALAIGVPFNSGGGSQRGHVRVYKNISGTWTKQGAYIDGEADDDESGVSVSLSLDGLTLAIGAPGNSGGGGSERGHVRVYKNFSGTWTKQGADIDGEADDDWSGYSVSLSSDGLTLAIGAPFNSGNGGSERGHVRVYKNIKGTWTKQGVDIDGEANRDHSGISVSLSSDGLTVAIGAHYAGSGGSERGHVRVYKNISGTWTKQGADINGEANRDWSGTSVSLSSDGLTLAIGAPGNSGRGGSERGHVRVYKNISGTWTKQGTDIDGEADGEASGWSVSLSSDGLTVAIGAPANSNSVDSGSAHVRVYKNINGTWTKLGADIDGEADDDGSGWSVSLSSNGLTVAIGAPANSGGGGLERGHVQVFRCTGSGNVEKTELSNIVVYPNPVTNLLNIELTSGTKQISITDVMGKIVLRTTIHQNSSLNLSELSAGIYTMSIYTETGTKNMKLVKQ